MIAEGGFDQRAEVGRADTSSAAGMVLRRAAAQADRDGAGGQDDLRGAYSHMMPTMGWPCPLAAATKSQQCSIMPQTSAKAPARPRGASGDGVSVAQAMMHYATPDGVLRFEQRAMSTDGQCEYLTIVQAPAEQEMLTEQCDHRKPAKSAT